MARIKYQPGYGGWNAGVWFNCPGCGNRHQLYTQHTPENVRGPRWQFNDNFERPTLTPSILARGGPKVRGSEVWDSNVVCHSFVTDGRIQFLGDCTHDLANQTVDLPEMDPGAD